MARMVIRYNIIMSSGQASWIEARSLTLDLSAPEVVRRCVDAERLAERERLHLSALDEAKVARRGRFHTKRKDKL